MDAEEKMHWVHTAIGMIVLACMYAWIALSIYPGWDFLTKFLSENIKIDWKFEQNAPAWVQAIGSILAIFATGGAAMWQVYKSRRLKEESDINNEISICETCIDMCDAVKSILRDANESYEKLIGYNSDDFMVGSSVQYIEFYAEKLKSLERASDLQESLRIMVAKNMPSELLRELFSLQKNVVLHKEFIMRLDDNLLRLRFESFDDKQNEIIKNILRIRKKLIVYKIMANRKLNK